MSFDRKHNPIYREVDHPKSKVPAGVSMGFFLITAAIGAMLVALINSVH